MAWACNVVAHHLRREVSQEDAPGVVHLVHAAPGLFDHQAQVLRGVVIGQVQGIVQCVHQHDSSPCLHGRLGCLLAGEAIQLPIEFLLDERYQPLRRGNQDWGSHHIVLRLPKKVGGAERGVGIVVRYNQGFRRPFQAIDLRFPVDHLLGQGHEDVAGSAHHIDFGNGLRAVGQRCYSLRASHLENPVHPGDEGCGHDRGVGPSFALGRCNQYNLLHARHLCRDGGHKHSGRVGRQAARAVDAHTLYRRDYLPEASLHIHPGPGQAGDVKVAYPAHGAP